MHFFVLFFFIVTETTYVVTGSEDTRREREAHLQGVEPSSVQEDGEADKVAVLCDDV